MDDVCYLVRHFSCFSISKLFYIKILIFFHKKIVSLMKVFIEIKKIYILEISKLNIIKNSRYSSRKIKNLKF